MAIDRKYGKVTTEFGNIGEDEPVIVFRAQDALLTLVLAEYTKLCAISGTPKYHINIILNTIGVIKDWQMKNRLKVKIPTSESSKERLPNG